jgi:hypothetical protein
MKKVIIGITMALYMTMGFAVCGSEKHPSQESINGISTARAFASQSASGVPMLHNQPDQDASIFSWTTILYLCATVIVVVAVRRHTYV